MFLDNKLLDTITELRHALHRCPELSGQEVKTRQLLMDFLAAHTSLEICPCGNGFYVAHRETSCKRPAIALRADYDALPLPDGTAGHLCGHDGHAAALCGAALATEGKIYNRNIFFLFQPAEETGEGAKDCLGLLEKESVDEIYGAHNLPEIPLGQITTRTGTFACGSFGLTLTFQGKPAHAAYPETGISPAPAVGEFLCQLPKLYAPDLYAGMTLCTVIGVEMGKKAFGSAASQGEIWLTLRGERDDDLEYLYQRIITLARELADRYHLSFSHEMQDVFPATANHPACAKKVLELLDGVTLERPMRWSEDFGHYLKRCPGAFFGIGAGKDYPALHTEGYEYPDELLEPTIKAFLKLVH